MSYFRHGYSSFEEFQREGLADPVQLGKEELELLQELEYDDDGAVVGSRTGWTG